MDQHIKEHLFDFCKGCTGIAPLLLVELLGKNIVTQALQAKIGAEPNGEEQASKLFMYLMNRPNDEFEFIEKALRKHSHTKEAELIKKGMTKVGLSCLHEDTAGSKSGSSKSPTTLVPQYQDSCFPNPFNSKKETNKNQDEPDKREDGIPYALIINVLNDRPGAEQDTPALSKTLRQCGFNVTECRGSEIEGRVDLKGSDILKGIEDFRKNLNSNSKGITGILVAVMSHGIKPMIEVKDANLHAKTGNFYSKFNYRVFVRFPASYKKNDEPMSLDDWFISADNKPLSLHDDIIEQFNGKNSPLLKDIPKIFLVNFCRGKINDIDFVSNDTICSELPNFADAAESSSSWKHMLIAFASYHGHPAVRNASGTKFIQEFCKVLKTCEKSTDIEDVIKQVSHNVSLDKTPEYGWQTPCLTNVLYWKEKLWIKWNSDSK